VEPETEGALVILDYVILFLSWGFHAGR